MTLTFMAPDGAGKLANAQVYSNWTLAGDRQARGTLFATQGTHAYIRHEHAPGAFGQWQTAQVAEAFVPGAP